MKGSTRLTSSLTLETRLGVDSGNLGIGSGLGLVTLQDVPGSSTVVVTRSSSTVSRVGLVGTGGRGLGAGDLSGSLGGSGSGGGLGSGGSSGLVTV